MPESRQHATRVRWGLTLSRGQLRQGRSRRFGGRTRELPPQIVARETEQRARAWALEVWC